MRSSSVGIAAAAAAAALAFGIAGPAAAAQAPNDRASCLALVFQAQAVDEPRTVSNRIKEIREFFLGDDQFGQVLKPLAQARCP